MEWFRVSATLLQSSISQDLITLTATEAQIAINDNDENITGEFWWNRPYTVMIL